MSITNQIIIPLPAGSLPASPTHHLSRDVNPPTQPKVHLSPLNLLWKKNNSAFKKFKERKRKKDHSHLPQHQENENIVPEAHTVVYKLKKKDARPPEKWNSDSIARVNHHTLSYYDPNEAPLYSCLMDQNQHEKIEICRQMIKNKQISYSTSKVEEDKRKQLKNRLQEKGMKMQEQNLRSEVPARDDDPFIIIRKNSKPKSNKSFKTKFIKKEKSYLSHEKSSSLENLVQKPGYEPKPIRSKAESSPVLPFVDHTPCKKEMREEPPDSCLVIEISSSVHSNMSPLSEWSSDKSLEIEAVECD